MERRIICRYVYSICKYSLVFITERYVTQKTKAASEISCIDIELKSTFNINRAYYGNSLIFNYLGFAINAYRDKILTSSLVNAQMLPAYKGERIPTLLKDGLWVLIAPALFAIILSIPAVLFQGTNAFFFMILASPAFLAAFLVTFFAPLIAAYSLVNQDKTSKWRSIFDTAAIRKIWRSLGPIGRSNYKHAAVTSCAAILVSFIGKFLPVREISKLGNTN